MRRLVSEVPDWKLTGLDALPLACQIARERSGCAVVEGRVEALPFADGAFVAVVSTDVLSSVEDDRAAIREIFRVLRPGGVFIANVPAYPWLWSCHDVATKSVRRYRRNELAGRIREAGFGEATGTYWNALTLPLIAFRRKCLPFAPGESDVKTYPFLIDRILGSLMGVEHGWIGLGGRWRFGCSELAVARKPQNNGHSEVSPSPSQNGHAGA